MDLFKFKLFAWLFIIIMKLWLLASFNAITWSVVGATNKCALNMGGNQSFLRSHPLSTQLETRCCMLFYDYSQAVRPRCTSAPHHHYCANVSMSSAVPGLTRALSSAPNTLDHWHATNEHFGVCGDDACIIEILANTLTSRAHVFACVCGGRIRD